MMQEQILFGDIKVCKGRHFNDDRGSFIKIYDKGLSFMESYNIQQVNFVVNHQKYILRGLHYQSGEAAESKIFRVISGSIQLGFVDVRQKIIGLRNNGSIIIDDPGFYVVLPQGYATGYCTMEENTQVLYFSDNAYSPENEKGIRYNDPGIQINWPMEKLIVSEKDLNWPDFKI